MKIFIYRTEDGYRLDLPRKDGMVMMFNIPLGGGRAQDMTSVKRILSLFIVEYQIETADPKNKDLIWSQSEPETVTIAIAAGSFKEVSDWAQTRLNKSVGGKIFVRIRSIQQADVSSVIILPEGASC